MASSVLIVDDEKHTREGLQQALEEEYDVYVARDATEAFNLLDAEPFDIVLTDLKMAGKSGMKVIDKAISLTNHRPVCIMMTAYGNVETAVDAMKRGAFDFLTKPINLEKLELVLRRALQVRKAEPEMKELQQARPQTKFNFRSLIGESDSLQEVIERVKLVAPSKATVMIDGETGTGKELIAQAIHQNSPRARRPFVTVHCAALPSNLLESELFGHEKGAFTGATERRAGRFEASDGGTLFLDEIGEIDAATQVKLLRFLEERTFERLGSVHPIAVDVRLVAATNRNLRAMVDEGTFREDLYYRLNVVSITIPPLRERKEDIPSLLDHYIRYYCRENNLPPLTVEPGAIRVLQEYRWPGNIRELRNLAENIVVLNRGRVTEYELDPKFHQPHSTPPEGGLTPLPESLSVAENEKRLLRTALMKAGGNRTQAAKIMGVSRRTLHRKLIQWPELDVLDK